MVIQAPEGSPKLRLGTHRLETPFRIRLIPRIETEFPKLRSQTEFGSKEILVLTLNTRSRSGRDSCRPLGETLPCACLWLLIQRSRCVCFVLLPLSTCNESH